MNANSIRYGIELETTLPRTNNTPIGHYHNGFSVAWLETGWKVESDSSIGAPDHRKAAEFVSPILQGTEGLEAIRKAATEIQRQGGMVNHTCGVHVTVEFDADQAALARLISLVARFERAMYAATGTKRREGGIYSRPIKKGNYENDSNSPKNKARFVQNQAGTHDRYRILNLTHLAKGKNKVEFRAFSGSLNPDKLIAWVRICVGLVEMALNTKRAVKWDIPETYKGKAGAGPGESDMAHLFYAIGWTKGRSKKVWGDLVNDNLPSLKDSKKVMMRMAKKYDQQ